MNWLLSIGAVLVSFCRLLADSFVILRLLEEEVMEVVALETVVLKNK
jgi:hypothetical protein